MMWKRQRFVALIFERVYIDSNMSWAEILDYTNSGDFAHDIVNDLFTMASIVVEENEKGDD